MRAQVHWLKRCNLAAAGQSNIPANASKRRGPKSSRLIKNGRSLPAVPDHVSVAYYWMTISTGVRSCARVGGLHQQALLAAPTTEIACAGTPHAPGHLFTALAPRIVRQCCRPPGPTCRWPVAVRACPGLEGVAVADRSAPRLECPSFQQNTMNDGGVTTGGGGGGPLRAGRTCSGSAWP